jgi:hypothetical protein
MEIWVQGICAPRKASRPEKLRENYWRGYKNETLSYMIAKGYPIVDCGHICHISESAFCCACLGKSYRCALCSLSWIRAMVI